MASPFVNVRFHAAGDEADRLRTIRAVRTGQAFADDESAARSYLARLLAADAARTLRGAAGARLPDLRLARTQDFEMERTRLARARGSRDLGGFRLLRFEQTREGIPVFGAHAVAELDARRRPLSLAARVIPNSAFDELPESGIITERQAVASIAATARTTTQTLELVGDAELRYYYDASAERMRLIYVFKNVPAAPPEFETSDSWRHRHPGPLDPPPCLFSPLLHYFVDAHAGDVVLFYSAVPYADPVLLEGQDELGVCHQFRGRREGERFVLEDPVTGIKTFDLEFKEVNSPLTGSGAGVDTAELGSSHRAAVSACVNARRVHDFFQSVVDRHGIDDDGKGLVSVIQCTYERAGRGREWRNACWAYGRMWYGQYFDPGTNRYVSFAQHLDIVAHELTHGVTESTANLIYHGLSGALNESFSDIFGIIVKNWYDSTKPLDADESPGRQAVHGGWSWEIGPGLGRDGGPLRDLSCPGRTGAPCHMDQYRPQVEDSGGVHRFSTIHSKAAYHVLTARGADSRPVFSPREVALLYYLALRNLAEDAQFDDALAALRNAAATYYVGFPAKRRLKIAAIDAAYRQVGITAADVGAATSTAEPSAAGGAS